MSTTVEPGTTRAPAPSRAPHRRLATAALTTAAVAGLVLGTLALPEPPATGVESGLSRP